MFEFVTVSSNLLTYNYEVGSFEGHSGWVKRICAKRGGGACDEARILKKMVLQKLLSVESK